MFNLKMHVDQRLLYCVHSDTNLIMKRISEREVQSKKASSRFPRITTTPLLSLLAA